MPTMPITIMMNETGSSLDITNAVKNVFDIATQGVTFISSNELLLTVFCASLAFIGLAFVGKAKKVARK